MKKVITMRMRRAAAALRGRALPVRTRALLFDGARLALDTLTGATAWIVASLLVESPANGVGDLGVTVACAALAAAAGGLLPGVRRARWRYFGFADLRDLWRAGALILLANSAALAALWQFGYLSRFPLRALLLFFLLTCGGMVATRVARRWSAGCLSDASSLPTAARASVIVAGDLRHTVPLAQLLAAGPQRPLALFDPHAVGQYRAQGIPIFSRLEDLERAALVADLDMLYLVELGEERRAYASLVHWAGARDVRVRVVSATGDPGLRDASELQQPPRISGLVSRRRHLVDLASLRGAYAGKRILVTGAAGSIGSEICRQLAGLDPRRLMLLDLTENDLCYLLDELRGAAPQSAIDGWVGDVRDQMLIARLLDELVPDIVLHVAARKHVNLMERQPDEAVRINVGGTMVLAEAARARGVERFVFVSTDKAVRPTSVMGATKGVAEQYLRHLAASGSETNFVSVRLGNVLGSSGSVLQLFQRQIVRGQPLTITDPQATRYFIDVGEAVHLILRAGMLGRSGQTLMLDMGRPVRVIDLAHNVAMAHGLDPELVAYKVIGLRPGERLHEELQGAQEELRPSGHPGLLIVEAHDAISPDHARLLQELRAAASAGDGPLVRKLLAMVTPGYRPARVAEAVTDQSPQLTAAAAAPQRLAA